MARYLYLQFTFLVSLFFLLATKSAYSQGPPIQTDTPIMLGVQGRGVRTFGKWIRKATLLKDGDKISSPQNTKINVWITPIAIPYNLFNDKFQMGIVVPFMRIRMVQTGNQLSNSGVGDVQLFAKYLLYQKDGRNKTFRIASKVGIKLPSGEKQNSLPLGSGSTDYIFSAVAGWIAGRVAIYGEGLYRWNSSNNNLTYGDAAGFNFAFGYRLIPAVYQTYPSPQLNAFLEVNGWFTNKDRLNNQISDNSGGSIVFFSPGIQYVGGRRWLVESSFQYPVLNRPNGVQLGTDWTLAVGTRILLF